jgi:hypothetical protein
MVVDLKFYFKYYQDMTESGVSIAEPQVATPTEAPPPPSTAPARPAEPASAAPQDTGNPPPEVPPTEGLPSEAAVDDNNANNHGQENQAAPETLRIPEEIRNKQMDDITDIGVLSVIRKGQSIENPTTPGEKAAWAIAQLAKYEQGPYITPERPDGFVLTNIQVPVGGELRTVYSITGRDGDNFTCKVLDANGHPITPPPAIRLVDLQIAQIASKTQEIAGLFPQSSARRELVDLLGSRDESRIPDSDPAKSAELNRTIQQAAREEGVFTVDDFNTFATNLGLDDAEKAAILEFTSGNILSERSFKAAFEKSDLSAGKLDDRMNAAQDLIDRLLQLPQRDKAQTKRLEDLQMEMQMLSAAKNLYSGEKLGEFFNKLQNGGYSAEAAKGFIDSFRSGKITEAAFQKFENDFPAFKRLEGESHEEWQKRVKKGLGIAGILLAMIVMSVGQSIPALGPEQAPRQG